MCHQSTIVHLHSEGGTVASPNDECSRGIGNSLGQYQPFPKHINWSTNLCDWDITCSHKQLIIPIDQVECTVHCTFYHVVLKNILSRNGCLCRYSGRIKIIISVYNTPLTIRLFDANFRSGMRRFTLTYDFCLMLGTEEVINNITLFLWQGTLSCDTIFGPRDQVTFRTDTSI